MERFLKFKLVMKCMKKAMKAIFWVLIGQLITAPINTLAAIPKRQQLLDLYAVKDVRPNIKPIMTNETVFNHILPPISPTNDEKALLKQIEIGIPQKWTDEFFRSDLFKKTPVGVATTKVEETVNQSVVISSTPSYGMAPPVEHKINLDVKVWEQRALVKYDGFFHSEFAYNHLVKTMNISISKEVATDTTLALTNTSPWGNIEKAGQVVLTYNF